jgi:serpin B
MIDSGPMSSTFDWTFVVTKWDRSSRGKRRKAGEKITISVVESLPAPPSTIPLPNGAVPNSCYGIQLGVKTEFQPNGTYDVTAIIHEGTNGKKYDYIVSNTYGSLTATGQKRSSLAVPVPTKLSATDAFELALYRKLAATVGDDENFVASPYSVTEALTMLRGGARGTTAQQIDAVINGGVPIDPLQRKQLREKLLYENPGFRTGTYVRIANSLWNSPGFPVAAEFSSLARDFYNAKITTTDFSDTTGSAKQINDWVSEVTEKQITAAVDPQVLDDRTQAVLVNAVLFHGRWSEEFPKSLTSKRGFSVGGKSVQASTMRGKSAAKVDAKQTEASVFYSGLYRMRIIMPMASTKAGLDLATAALYSGPRATNPEVVCGDVPTSLPKWKVESSMDLNDQLIALGIKDAFDQTRADLTGISPSAVTTRLFVSKSLQKAKIEVDEEGTIAAAATVVAANAISKSLIKPVCPKEVKFDRPFVYAIQHYETGQVLFAGRVMDPTK